MNDYNWNKAFPDTPESFKNKVETTLNSLSDEKEKDKMINKKVSIRKKIIVALATAMILGTTVFASGKIFSITSQQSNIPTYTTMPTVKQVKDDLGFKPKLVKEFTNGYTFASGYTKNNEGTDEKGNSVAKTKSLHFTYAKGNDKVSLFMENGRLGERSKKETVIAAFNGVDLYYYSYANKIVPADYKLTEQDKQDESSGKYVFSYGSDKVEISQIQSLNWMQDGINYSFLAIDSNISKDELTKMAQQVVNKK